MEDRRTEWFQGERLDAGGTPPRAYQRGRLCCKPGCRTLLSIYNSGSLCAEHESQLNRAEQQKVS